MFHRGSSKTGSKNPNREEASERTIAQVGSGPRTGQVPRPEWQRNAQYQGGHQSGPQTHAQPEHWWVKVLTYMVICKKNITKIE